MYHVKGYPDDVQIKDWISIRNKEEKRSKSRNEALWEKELARLKDKCLSDDENPSEDAIVTRWDKARLATQKEEEKEDMARPSNKQLKLEKVIADLRKEYSDLEGKLIKIDTKLLGFNTGISDSQLFLMGIQRDFMAGTARTIERRIADLEEQSQE